jgi:hypothetical protein
MPLATTFRAYTPDSVGRFSSRRQDERLVLAQDNVPLLRGAVYDGNAESSLYLTLRYVSRFLPAPTHAGSYLTKRFSARIHHLWICSNLNTSRNALFRALSVARGSSLGTLSTSPVDLLENAPVLLPVPANFLVSHSACPLVSKTYEVGVRASSMSDAFCAFA